MALVAWRFWVVLIAVANCFAQMPVFPLRDVRAGQHGVGRTVLTGNKIEEFQVEILGVLEDMGPKQSIILARLSGAGLENAGVMQGMSGSPVYIDGRLVGAVALAFPFSKDPIAGIRPIEDMLRTSAPPTKQAGARPALFAPELTANVQPADTVGLGNARMAAISTPVSFSGFSERTIDYFAPQLKRLGLEPRQGVSGGGHPAPGIGKASELRPGEMITVELMSGDMSVGADGTVTAIDGKRVYAFGHQFLSVGDTELPFARADVITILPNYQASFKISTAREWMGAILQDRSTAIAGELGRQAETAPVAIDVNGANGAVSRYRMRMAIDPILSPLLLQMAVFSTIDATERTFGAATYTIRGQVDFEGGTGPLRVDNTFSGDFAVPQVASLSIASPFAYALAAGFNALKVRDVRLAIGVAERKRVLQVDQISASRRTVRPGDAVDIAVTLEGDNGKEELRTVHYNVPVGTPVGALQFTVSDAFTTNLLNYAQTIGMAPKSPTQVLAFLNDLRPNTKAYVRVWTTDPAYQVQGADLPDPPASLALILARSQGAPGVLSLLRGSGLAELEIDGGDNVITGSKTVQVEVKE
ncbi:MAG: SpoIVB peptidase S55 domain-containing protein [Bryobacteraceae bacterium]|jgi:hypothetical protein